MPEKSNRRIGCGTLTLGLFALAALAAVSGPHISLMVIKSPGVAIAFFRYGSSIAIFAIASFLVYRLWKLVLEALGGGSSVLARGLLQLLGNIGVDAQPSESTRVRIKGVGLLGTLMIIVSSILAIYFILGSNVGNP